MSKDAKDKSKCGPKEERLKMSGNWETSVGNALEKKRPDNGWPKSEPTKKRDPKK